MTNMKWLRHIRQTLSNTKNKLSNEEWHKHKDYKENNDKKELLNEECSDDSFDSITLQKCVSKTKKRKWHEEELFSELKKIKPPSFYGEFEEGEESWVVNMSIYFQFYNYLGNLKSIVVV